MPHGAKAQSSMAEGHGDGITSGHTVGSSMEPSASTVREQTTQMPGSGLLSPFYLGQDP